MPEDVIDLILAQHARIEDLFAEAASEDPGQRRESFQELARLLAVHETAEEELIHPLARDSDGDADPVVDAHLEEERLAKELLASMVDEGTAAPGYPANLLRLREMVLTHAEHEERHEFPRLRLRFGERLVGLTIPFRAAEALAPTRPHPGVESAAANLALGPFLAIADRVRDAIRDAKEG